MEIRAFNWSTAALSAMLFTAGISCGSSLVNASGHSWADNAMALSAYIHAQQSATSFGFSPESLRRVLLLLYDGAAGDTKRELSQLLGTTSAEEPRPNANDEAILATGVFVRKPLRIAEQFKTLVESKYEATVLSVDAHDGGKVINAWVRKTTKGEIRGIMDTDRLRADLVAVNSLYFKGKWLHPFDPQLTRKARFFGSTAESKIPFMRIDGRFAYRANRDIEAIALPYAGGRYALEILMPLRKSSITVGRMLAEPNNLLDMRGAPERYGKVEIPRFEIVSRFVLNDALSAEGLKTSFDLNRADFTPMTSQRAPLCIGRVVQKVRLSVDEEGTIASAVTAVEMVGSIAPDPQFTFVADHPFLFIIRRIRDNAIFFVGVFDPPKQ